MNKFNQYDFVKIVRINKQFSKEECTLGKRIPKVGDKASIIEVYEKPCLGYELESTNEQGETNWLVTINSEDLEMELIAPSRI